MIQVIEILVSVIMIVVIQTQELSQGKLVIIHPRIIAGIGTITAVEQWKQLTVGETRSANTPGQGG